MANTNSDAELWDTCFEPNMDEFAAMVSHLSDRFTPQHFRLLTGISAGHWALVAAGKRECDKLVKRVVWFMYMLDTCPDKLLSAFTSTEAIFMWGKNLTHIPKLKEMCAAEKLRVMEDYIRLIKTKNRAYSIDEIAVTCHVSPGQVVKACKRLHYRTGLHNVADVYVAGSRWYDMDWRKSAVELSRQWNIKLSAVQAARNKLVAMPVVIAARNIYRSKNARFLWFYHLWDDVKQIEVQQEAERLKAASIISVDKMANRELPVLQQHESNTGQVEEKAAGDVPDHAGECHVPATDGGAGPSQIVDDQRGAAAHG
jgi:hypothetical protein